MALDNILRELQAERDKLDKAIAAIQSLSEDSAPSMSNSTPAKSAAKTAGKRRGRPPLSAEARARIGAAARRRWAKQKAAQKKSTAATASSKK